MIINQTGGGNVDASMDTKYKISVKTVERVINFAIESDLYCQEFGITPIDYTAWNAAGLNFWDWFLETNGFYSAFVTKWFKANSSNSATASADEEVCMLELELRGDSDVIVETIPGGYLQPFCSNAIDADAGDHQIYFYVKDENDENRILTYKSAPNGSETAIDFCLWDPDISGGGLAAPIAEPGR